MANTPMPDRAAAVVVRDNINSRFTEQYEHINSNYIFAGGVGPDAANQLIPVKVWTPVLWPVVPGNVSGAVLMPDKIRWAHDASVQRAMGLWASIVTVAWENTDAALVAPHRRLIRFAVAPQSTGVYVAEGEREYLFHPDMGDLSIPSHTGTLTQDKHGVSSYLRCEVWHNAEVPINLTTVGFTAPLLMRAKVSEL